ncbi:hypothetical protein HYH02_010720 [Chlamydomonas schloesseri]|uniref:Galactose oxidase-like Early set domain-containing protein n=1 Tax=Chlamydomonas schloesseri TaxID=2026947 RepID=A0A835W7W9_9CHLO|nr:hypothetical protein HYH02_010720 [Chlamydomonas schloesseri]|eukprot:KAG2438926.1 hypothetical protein HYH02_010720 [Chlamydomonas schloesseri]
MGFGSADEVENHGRILLDTPKTAGSFKMLPFTAKAVSLSMVSIPRSRKYVQGWRRVNSAWTLMAGTIDLDAQNTTGYAPGIAIGCSGPIMMEDGAPLYVGGEFGNSGKKPANIDARNFVTRYDAATGKYTPIGKLSVPRWYPTALRLNDGKVLVVGGTANADKGPAYNFSELWDSNNPTAPPVPVPHPSGFSASMGLNYYPFMALLPNREILWWGNRGGSITTGDYPFTKIMDLPPLPDHYGPWHTMYPYTATVVLHALRPDPVTGAYNTFSFTIFGGQNPKKVGPNTPAADKSARLDFTYCGPTKSDICIVNGVNGTWQIEAMPDRRLLADAIVLPNERIFVHGGATTGFAGVTARGLKAANGAPVSFAYDPTKPQFNRYQTTDPVVVMRSYHSTACLDITGGILSSGCDECNLPIPSGFEGKILPNPTGDAGEFRLTMGIPAEIRDADRPVITAAPDLIHRGDTFTVSYTYTGGAAITGVSLTTPCASTHCINMNQRVVMLPFTVDATTGTLTVTAPPAAQHGVAPRGEYVLWLLGGPIMLEDGSIVYMGGEFGNSGSKPVNIDGRNYTTLYDAATGKYTAIGRLSVPRWYPTALRLNDGKVLVVGGTADADKGPAYNYSELWDSNNPTAETVRVEHPPAFNASMGLNYYPFMALLPNREILWWGNRGGSITTGDYPFTKIMDLPPLPNHYGPWHTMYPYTATVVLHALRPDPVTGAYNTFSFTIFGGQNPVKVGPNTPAANVSARLDFSYCGPSMLDICIVNGVNGAWQIEAMPDRRLLADAVVLPNERIFVHGGATTGYAGVTATGLKAANGAPVSFAYDPNKPELERYQTTASVLVMRSYHSTACLDITGGILSSGCDECKLPVPSGYEGLIDPIPVAYGDFDYRLTMGIPTEVRDVQRPVIAAAPDVIHRGTTFSVSYTYTSGAAITGVSLTTPCASTHSINMNQRVVMLPFTVDATTGTLTVTAPPATQHGVAPRGEYVLWLLGAEVRSFGRTYSEGHWVTLKD